MDTDQTLFLNGETTEITTQLPDISSQLPEITSSITSMLAPFILLSLVVSVLFAALYITSMIRRRKLENAILDMQKILHEMNDRDKRLSSPQSPPLPEPRISNDTIARAEPQADAVETTLS